MAESEDGWGIACRVAEQFTSVWSATLTDATRASISGNDREALVADMRQAVMEAFKEQAERVFELLAAMVQRWPKEGSTDDIIELAAILGVEIWTRLQPSPGSGEMRFRPCPDGLDLDPESIMGEDTTGWEQMGG